MSGVTSRPITSISLSSSLHIPLGHSVQANPDACPGPCLSHPGRRRPAFGFITRLPLTTFSKVLSSTSESRLDVFVHHIATLSKASSMPGVVARPGPRGNSSLINSSLPAAVEICYFRHFVGQMWLQYGGPKNLMTCPSWSDGFP